MTNDPVDRKGFDLFQIGLNVSDMAAALRFYAEAFGFANGGGQAGWGPGMVLQGLEPSGQALIWWMVAAQPRMQLELFRHTGPLQRPQRADWTPADHGWSRIGIAVTCFESVLDRLAAAGVMPISSVATRHGLSRTAIRDPYSGIVIEVLEDGPGLPGYPRERVHNLDPAVLYAATSVADLAAARRFYGEQIGLEIVPLGTLHEPGDEALWGLDGAERSGFVAKAGPGLIEVVEYSRPSGRPRRDDHRASDQGIMNIGLFAPSTASVEWVIGRLDAEGRPPLALVEGPGILGIYILEADRELELFSCPAAIEAHLGFTPTGFLGVASGTGKDLIRIVRREFD